MTMLAEIQDVRIDVLRGYSVRVESKTGQVAWGASQGTTAEGAAVKFRAWWSENMHRAYGDIETLRVREDNSALNLGTCMVTLFR